MRAKTQSKAPEFHGYRVPFNRPSLMGQELEYCRQAIERGHLSGDGHFTQLCDSELAKVTGAAKVLLTTSCTHALEMSALLLNLAEGDEVIVPSFTFVSSANAFVVHGARPIFADVRADTLNLNPKELERLITPHTKAIVPVHYGGVGCDMEEIMAIAEKHKLTVIEDNAHGLFASYKGRPLGSYGALSTLSFHETKNLSCGEGGALLVNDLQFFERAEIIREKGTDRSRFFRGQVDKYTWSDLGSSYLPSDLLAAYLYGQLEQSERIQMLRKMIWTRYASALEDWSCKHGVTLPTVPANCEQAYHLFFLLMPSLEVRTRFIQYLKECGILAVYHYLPLHLSPMGQRFGGRAGDCPVTESVSDRLVRLPFFTALSEEQQAEVIEAILSFNSW